MTVFVANEQNLPVDEVRLSTLGHHTLASEDLDDGVELSVLCVTSDHMRQLNARFAGNDYATDVLAFPLTEDDEPATVLGDVVICPRVAEVNAQRLGHDLEYELDTLLVHGTLHLLGYDHQNEADKSKMDARQKSVLDSFEPTRS
ncbi:MAG: rRNA maturation RNase YbeY [Actinomycetota bacterium]